MAREAAQNTQRAARLLFSSAIIWRTGLFSSVRRPMAGGGGGKGLIPCHPVARQRVLRTKQGLRGEGGRRDGRHGCRRCGATDREGLVPVKAIEWVVDPMAHVRHSLSCQWCGQRRRLYFGVKRHKWERSNRAIVPRVAVCSALGGEPSGGRANPERQRHPLSKIVDCSSHCLASCVRPWHASTGSEKVTVINRPQG